MILNLWKERGWKDFEFVIIYYLKIYKFINFRINDE